MHMPCHKCSVCAKRRAALWKRRIAAEYRWSVRTWLGTLTVEPQQRFEVELAAKRKARLSGVDWAACPPLEQWKRLHQQIGPELTKYLKRIRTNSEAPFRFVLVGELHTNGWPHYHVVLNEVSTMHPVRHKVLKAGYNLGFCTWKLVQDLSGATYVAKYLTKSDVSGWARVRASQHYGQTPYGVKVSLLGDWKNQTPSPDSEGYQGNF